MRMLTAEESEYQRVLERLLHDLQSKSTLCCAADYPGVTVEELNTHVHQHGPLQNAAFGEMHGFWVDDGYLTPYRNVVPGCCELAPAIAMVVRNWDRHDGRNGVHLRRADGEAHHCENAQCHVHSSARAQTKR